MPKFETNLTQDKIDLFTATGAWGDRLICDYVDEAARRTPEKTAIFDSRGAYTFAELQFLTVRCAYGLLALGLKPRDVLSLQLPNWKEWAVIHVAAARIGVITNPLVPMFRDRELSYILNMAETKVLVVPESFRNYDHMALGKRLKAELPQLEHVLVIGGEVSVDLLSWERFIATAWETNADISPLANLRPDASEVTEIIFTSGTTGEPKGVLHTHNTLISSQEAVIEVLQLTGDAVLHIASTFGHQTGVLSGVRLPLQLGATCVYQDIWKIETLLDLIVEHGITMTSGGPTFLQDLLSSPDLERRDLSSLRIFRCGGAPIPRMLIAEIKDKLPQVSVHSAWGQTENAIVTLTRPDDDPEKIAETDGSPLRGMEIRVVDGAGHTLRAGSEGRLQCRGPSLFVGYAKRPDRNRESFTDDGWFDTGDLAAIDAQGFVRITGRTKDIIIRGGENIPVAYVENVLYEDRRIQDAAVVGMPDARLGERACAFLILRTADGYSLNDMQRYLEQKGVAKQYWPEDLRIVEEMPRTPSGKIRKHELKALLS